ncbi:hypothetical protein WAE58_21585 [Pedobacter panaciterrae]|uniref:Helix-turn-helix protein n=1 Tax=Pedobacter panaciterrae TaxID=363849 RepID=A0ABU8NS25_9SPHI
MNYHPNRTVIYSDIERSIVYDFWFNPNQTMQQLAEKFGISPYKATALTSQFIRTKDQERQKILKEGSVILQSKINDNKHKL